MTKFDMPKISLHGVLAMHKANLETFVQAQKVLADAGQAIARLQYGLVQDAMKSYPAFLKLDGKTKPDAAVADTKAATGKAMSVAKQQLDLGVKAQGEVAQMFVKRAVSNLDELKSFAAA